jgi:serine/threonine-protein kinase
MTTTILKPNQTLTLSGSEAVHCPDELLERYQGLVHEKRLGWTQHLRLSRLLGVGGQGVVYLSERRGTDNFTLPVAIKIFSPERCSPTARSPRARRRQVASVAGFARTEN